MSKEPTLGEIDIKIGYIQKDIAKINERMAKDYATNSSVEKISLRLSIVERIVYGLVSLILVGVVGALLKFVIIS